MGRPGLDSRHPGPDLRRPGHADRRARRDDGRAGAREATRRARPATLSARQETPEAPLPPSRDAPSEALVVRMDAQGTCRDTQGVACDALDSTSAPLGASCVAHFSEFDACASKGAAAGTDWHRLITSREAQGNRREARVTRREALAVPCASLAASRVSNVETSAPRRSTCAAISVACDSMVETCAAISSPRAVRIEACASPAMPSGPIVTPWGAEPGSTASIVASRAAGVGGHGAIVVGCASIVARCGSIVARRASIVASRASLVTSRASPARLDGPRDVVDTPVVTVELRRMTSKPGVTQARRPFDTAHRARRPRPRRAHP